MPLHRHFLAVAMLSVLVVGLLTVLSMQSQYSVTGNVIGRGKAPELPKSTKYCHGWEQGLEACFMTSRGIKPFQCQNYYWLPAKENLLKCCAAYFDCRSSGMFRLSSYCDQKTHTCKLQ